MICLIVMLIALLIALLLLLLIGFSVVLVDASLLVLVRLFC